MKPFNLQDALNGDPVVTRDGRPFLGIHKFDITKEGAIYSVVGVVDGEISARTAYGTVFSAVPDKNDLFMAPKEVTLWVNFYPTGKAVSHTSEEIAHRDAGVRAIHVAVPFKGTL